MFAGKGAGPIHRRMCSLVQKAEKTENLQYQDIAVPGLGFAQRISISEEKNEISTSAHLSPLCCRPRLSRRCRGLRTYR
jgi:hypothetical protein